jgi:hypothetical protein
MNFEKFRLTQWQYMYVGPEVAKIEFIDFIMLAILYHHQLSICGSPEPDPLPKKSQMVPKSVFCVECAPINTFALQTFFC